MDFNIRQQGRKSDRDKYIIKFFKSPAFMASGISIIFLSCDPDELGQRSKLILQEKHAGSKFDLFNKEIVAIVDKIRL